MSDLAGRIAFARGLVDLSAARLGTLAGLSQSIVAMIESGARRDMLGTTVASIARVLGVSTDWLLTGAGDEPTRDQVAAAVAQAQAEEPAADTERAAS